MNTYSGPSAFSHPAEDRPDSVQYMLIRRLFSDGLAEVPINFNEEGLKAGELLLGRELTPADAVVDIGSSTGGIIAEAALKTGVKARIFCVEPDVDGANTFLRLEKPLRERVALFVQAHGEHLPFADNSMQGATLHNVIFRAQDAPAMLVEAKRVVEPGGFIAISSNARGHAAHRHAFEQLVAKEVMLRAGIEFTPPRVPAEGFYLEDLPDLIQQVGGLAMVESLFIQQNSRTIITSGEPLHAYLDSLKYSAANTNLPGKYRAVWRQVVDTVIRPDIEERMLAKARELQEQGDSSLPYFDDPIKRGMYVLRNEKA